MGLPLVALMAATRLTRLRRQTGREPDGTDRLRLIYDRFTEGFEEQEMVMARNLLDSG